MNRTGKRRLLKLADMLEADAKNKKGVTFNIMTVGRPTEELGDGEKFEPSVSCGTTACAMGLAAISGAFKRAGLSYKVVEDSWNPTGWSIVTTLNGRVREYDKAAKKVFDLTQNEAYFLFSPSQYNDPPKGAGGEKIVAKRIRDLVAGEIKAPRKKISW